MNDTRYLPIPPKTRTLGPNGPLVSTLAWGMWRFKGTDLSLARSLVDAALEAGITLFDTADIYGPDNDEPFGASETLLGQLLDADPALRSKMVLATKGGIIIGVPYDSSADYIGKAIDASLTRLKTDYVDLWQIHRPDILTHPQEIARALGDAHHAGKIGAIGVSNFTAAQTAALAKFVTIPLVTTQPEFSALKLDAIDTGLLDQSIERGMTPLAWSPLGGGRIAFPTTKRELDVAEALDAVATTFGVSRTAAAYSWIMAHPAGIIPIVGSQQTTRIAEAVDAYKVRWTRTDWYKILVASKQEPLP